LFSVDEFIATFLAQVLDVFNEKEVRGRVAGNENDLSSTFGQVKGYCGTDASCTALKKKILAVIDSAWVDQERTVIMTILECICRSEPFEAPLQYHFIAPSTVVAKRNLKTLQELIPPGTPLKTNSAKNGIGMAVDNQNVNRKHLTFIDLSLWKVEMSSRIKFL
jgi:hypothetical protein